MIENSFVNWHPDPEFKGCHKECRDGLPEPEPKSEVSEKRYDVSDESSNRKEFLITDEREFTIYGQPKWNDDDESMLEEMWKDGKSIEEIADALTRMLPHGYDRSEGAVRARIKKKRIEEKTGRYLTKRKFHRWTPDDDLRLEEMYGDWQDVPEIMEALGRSEGAIRIRVKNKEIDERTGRPLPPTEKHLRWLEKLGYDGPKPSTGNEAWELSEVWFEKPTSPQLESKLRATGYDGPTPETNRETVEKTHEMVWINDPITEPQTRKIKQICQLIGEEVGELPTNKWEASLLIDRLKKKAEQMGIDVPKLNRITSTGKKKKRSTPDYEDDDEEDDDEEDDDEEDEWNEELIPHETDDDKRGDEDPHGIITDVDDDED